MQASPSRPEFARDSASSFAEAGPSSSAPSTTEGKENQPGKSGLFSKYKGKYKTYLAERRAGSKSRTSQDLDSVAESAIASYKKPSKEAAAAAQAADNAALDKDMDSFFEEVSQIKVHHHNPFVNLGSVDKQFCS